MRSGVTAWPRLESGRPSFPEQGRRDRRPRPAPNKLREQLLEDYTEVIPLNRELTLQRYHLRARAVSFLLWSLFAAVAATILMMVTAKFGLLKVTP